MVESVLWRVGRLAFVRDGFPDLCMFDSYPASLAKGR